VRFYSGDNMILFLGFKFGSVFFPHGRKTVPGLLRLSLNWSNDNMTHSLCDKKKTN